MDDDQKHQTVHMLPRGKATAKFREQHEKSTAKSPSAPTGQYKPKQQAANANGVFATVEQRLDAVLADRLKGISNAKIRKVIEESVREEALKKLAQIMPGEVTRAVDSSIAEISRSMGVTVPGRPSSPPSYPGTPSPTSSGGKTSSSSRYGGKSSPPPAPPPPPPSPPSRGHGGKYSSRSYGGK